MVGGQVGEALVVAHWVVAVVAARQVVAVACKLKMSIFPKHRRCTLFHSNRKLRWRYTAVRHAHCIQLPLLPALLRLDSQPSCSQTSHRKSSHSRSHLKVCSTLLPPSHSLQIDTARQSNLGKRPSTGTGHLETAHSPMHTAAQIAQRLPQCQASYTQVQRYEKRRCRCRWRWCTPTHHTVTAWRDPL